MTLPIMKLKDILINKKMTISVAESLTGGNLQSLLTCLPGSSEFFVGGITAYNINQKVKHLKVNRKDAKAVNCVSESIAIQMANGVHKMFKSDISISTTGYISNNDNHKAHAYYAINIKGNIVKSGLLDDLTDNRETNQVYVSALVIDELIKILSND